MTGEFGAVWFRLGRAGERGGITCGEHGAFAGTVPLLSEIEDARRCPSWAPRPVSALNGALSAVYGLPVDVTAKMGGLAAVAGALNAGNLALARIAMVHLQLPDPPQLEKGLQSRDEIVALAALLHRSGILSVTKDGVGGGVLKRDVSDEPRIPRGQRSGGEWTTDGASEATTSPIIPVQELVIRPAPFDAPFPYPLRPPLPFPGRPPVPLDVPGMGREGIPANPYPDRPECVEEWNEATRYCLDLFTKGRLGKQGYRGMGQNLYDCVMGQVSEECGGNATGA